MKLKKRILRIWQQDTFNRNFEITLTIGPLLPMQLTPASGTAPANII